MRLPCTLSLPPYTLTWDARAPLSCLALPVRFGAPGASPSCFGVPDAAAAPFASGSFSASVGEDGSGSCNCPVISSLCAHTNGTHTECVGHVLPAGRVTLEDVHVARTTGVLPAVLLSVTPVPLRDSGDTYAPGAPDDAVVSFACLQAALAALAGEGEDEGEDWGGDAGVGVAAGAGAPPAGAPAVSRQAVALRALRGGALIVRTLPNDASKRSRAWSGANAPYLTPAAAAWAVAQGVEHLLVDLPSLDRENDGGELATHRAFWGLPRRAAAGGTAAGPAATVAPQLPPCARTVTELCYIDSTEVPRDGAYVLNLAVAPLSLDAAPSRPVLYAAIVGRA